MNIRAKLNKYAALLTALCLLLSLGVHAHEIPDPGKTGSFSVTVTYDGRAVSGGTLTLYRVGDIYEDDGNYGFVPTDAFSPSGLTLDDVTSGALAEQLAAYAAENRLAGDELRIGADGKAEADGLAPGLYLVVQRTAADGYEALSPFLVSIPMHENGEYIYDVDATPKISPIKPKPDIPDNPPPPPDEPDEPDKPDIPETTPETDKPTPETIPETTEPETIPETEPETIPQDTETEPETEPDPETTPPETEPEPETTEPDTGEPDIQDLPQTGQLNWPVPVMVLSGLCLILLGWSLRYGKRHEK